MTKIFINYRTGDESFAAVTLDDSLSARFGKENVFRDSRSIPPGQDFEPVLWGNLARSSLLVVVIGHRWLADGKLHRAGDFVREEIAFALKIGLDIMPVLVGGVPKPSADDLPEEIKAMADRQYRRIHARSAAADVRAVVDDVAALLGEPDMGPTAAADDPPPSTRPDAGAGVEVRDLHGDLVMGDKVGRDKIVRWSGRRA